MVNKSHARVFVSAETYLEECNLASEYVRNRQGDLQSLRAIMCFTPWTTDGLHCVMYDEVSILVQAGECGHIEVALRSSDCEPIYVHTMEQVYAYLLARFW